MDSKIVPPEFHETNKSRKNRSIDLAERAKSWLIEHNLVPCTEETFFNATKTIDKDGKGISHSTIYKNEIVHEIFQSVGKNTQNKPTRKKKSTSKSKRSQAKQLRDKYKDLTRIEIIIKINDLITKNNELKRKNQNLVEKHKLLQEQFNNQLVVLTELKEEGKF